MSYGGGRYGSSTYGGARSGRAGRPPGALLIPAFDAAYYWAGSGAAGGAYGEVAWGGRGSVLTPTAGIGAVPDPIGLAVTLPLWWAFAEAASVVRVGADGSVVSVRDGAVGLRPEQSRRNQSVNPSARDGLSGYAAGPNTNISRLTGLSRATVGLDQVSTAARATSAASGTIHLALNVDSQDVTPADYQWQVRTSSVAGTLGLSIAWYNATDTLVGTYPYPVADAMRQAAGAGDGTFATVRVRVDNWPSTAEYGVVTYRATGMPAGATMDVTARLREPTLRGPYFDGDHFGGGWVGTPGLSHSDIAEVVYVTDAEAPLDVPVHYELTSSQAPGYVVRTEQIVLPSTDMTGVRQVVLTHPGKAASIRVWVEAEPKSLNRELAQGVFKLKGRRFPVVVSEDQRGGDQGTLTFIAENFTERDRLMAFLDDGSPVLVRTPARFGHPPDWWLSFGAVSIEHWTHDATRQLRRIEAAFVQVDRPDAATRPLAI